MLKRIPALDGLRAIAILAVLGSHIVSTLIPGSFGVTLFFFISGFIITRLLLEDGRPRLVPFYIRRFFRLYPALLAYVVACVIAAKLSGESVSLRSVAGVLFFFTNYLDGTSAYFTHTWSLAVEEHFYILFPLLVLLLHRRPERLQAALILCAVICVGLRSYELYAGVASGAIQGQTHTRLDSIAYGCLLSVLFYRAEGSARVAKLLDLLSTRRALVAGVLLLASTFAFRSEAFRQTLRYSMQGLSFAVFCCVLFWGKSAPRVIVGLLESRPMVYIGAVSYSLYLFHQLARTLAYQMGFVQYTVSHIAVTLSISAPLVLISYYFVEGPCRRYGAALAATLRSDEAHASANGPTSSAAR